MGTDYRIDPSCLIKDMYDILDVSYEDNWPAMEFHTEVSYLNDKVKADNTVDFANKVYKRAFDKVLSKYQDDMVLRDSQRSTEGKHKY
ncbi:MAG: hypothetical protein ACQEP1_03925 [Nanobdellota archaeon]